jgi:hypothetical protein
MRWAEEITQREDGARLHLKKIVAPSNKAVV